MALPIVVIGILLAVLAGAWIEVRHAERAERLADRLLMGSLYLLAPPVIFFNLVHLEFSLDRSLGLVLAWVAVLGAGLVAFLLTRTRVSRPVAGAVIVSVLSANTAYLGYPLTTIVFGPAHLPEAVSYDALVTILVLVTAGFGVGAAFGQEAGEGARERARSFIVRNPLLPVFALALVAPDSWAPPLAVELSHILVFALLPVGFFAVGVHLAATSPGRLSLPPLSRPVLLAVGLRLIAVPALLFALTAPWLDIPVTYLFMAAMPTGLNSLLVANAFGLDRRVAAGAIAWSTAIVLLACGLVTALGGL